MWLILSFLFIFLSIRTGHCDEDKLLLSVVVFREGDRSPLYIPDNDPYKSQWMKAGGLGVVTEIGKKKMFSLGQYIQKRYNSSIIDGPISSKNVIVRSVKYDRNVVSARKVLKGFTSSFPSSIQVEDIPIKTHDDDIMMVDACPAYKRELEKYKNQSLDFGLIDSQESEFYRMIQENTNCQCNSMCDVERCMDPVICESTEGLGLPSWCNSTCYNHAMSLLDMDWKLEVANPKLLNMRMQPFINEMLTKIEKYVSGAETTFQLNLFSSIGYAIPMLIQSIGVENFEPHVPKFGAALFFELRRIRGKMIVNISYQASEVGQVKKLYIRGCGIDCEYRRLVQILPPLLKKNRLPCGK